MELNVCVEVYPEEEEYRPRPTRPPLIVRPPPRKPGESPLFPIFTEMPPTRKPNFEKLPEEENTETLPEGDRNKEKNNLNPLVPIRTRKPARRPFVPRPTHRRPDYFGDKQDDDEFLSQSNPIENRFRFHIQYPRRTIQTMIVLQPMVLPPRSDCRFFRTFLELISPPAF